MSAQPIPATTKLWEHQEAGVRFALERENGALFAMLMGHGKTLATIELLRRRGFNRILILSPKSVQTTWGAEFEKHASSEFQVMVLNHGNVKDKTELAKACVTAAEHRGCPCVLVINHESSWRTPFADWAMKAGFDCLVVDECHRAKSPSGRFSTFLGRLANRIPYRLGLTGTPMPHSPLDIYAQFRFIDPSVFGTSYVRFRNHFAIMGGFEGHHVVGYKNEPEMRAKFRAVAYESKPDAVELPPSIDVERGFLLEGAAAKLYRDVERDFYAELASGTVTAANALTRLLRLQQITGGAIRDDDGVTHEVHQDKAALLGDLLEDIEPREPVVVFARFRHDLDEIRRVSIAAGRRVAELSGRANELDAFQRGDADVIAVQIQAGGVGISLVRARTCVYYSLGFNLAEYLQSRARVLRPGQTRSVLYVHLVAKGTVDEKVYAALRKRQDVVESILRGAI
jgi:SNF2 family DNA or RNA helicase